MRQAGHSEAVEAGLHPHIFLEGNGLRDILFQDLAQSPLPGGWRYTCPTCPPLGTERPSPGLVKDWEVTVLKAHTDAWCQLCHHLLATWTRRQAARGTEARASVRPQVPSACSSLAASKPLSAAEASVSLGFLS